MTAVISLSIVFTRFSAVIAIERDWWRRMCEKNKRKTDTMRTKLMAFFFLSSPIVFSSSKIKVWHRTINDNGQHVTLWPSKFLLSEKWRKVSSLPSAGYAIYHIWSDINLFGALHNYWNGNRLTSFNHGEPRGTWRGREKLSWIKSYFISFGNWEACRSFRCTLNCDIRGDSVNFLAASDKNYDGSSLRSHFSRLNRHLQNFKSSR